MSGACCNVGVEEVGPGVGLDEDKFGRLIWRVGIAAVLAGQSMMLGLGINMTPPVFGSTVYWVLHGILFCAAVIVLFLLGGGLMLSSFESWKKREISVESLFFLSMSGALVASVISTVTGRGEVYYEVVAIVLCIYTVGKALGVRSREKAIRESSKLKDSFDFAYVVKDGKKERVPLESVGCCCDVYVGPGDAVTVDGVILEGEGYVKETAMTGELEAKPLSVGDFVFAGSYSVDGVLKIRPTAVKGERRLDVLIESVEQARLAPSVLQDQANRVMKWFLPTVVIMSLGTFVYWEGQGTWVTALFNSMSVLLVACPCALGLATPLAIWSGLWKLSTLGMVSRSGDFLDTLARADRVIFDKTGTLSDTELRVSNVFIQERFEERRDEILGMVKSVEMKIEHPIARALTGLVTMSKCSYEVVDTKVVPGRGVSAEIENEGVLFIGERMGELSEEIKPEGKKVVYVYLDRVLVGWISLIETMRADVQGAVKDLWELGVKGTVLTGDRGYVEGFLEGMEVKSGLTPMEKEEYVQGAEKRGECVIFVGDGVNDAGAMSCSAGSIAMGSGAALTKSSASAVLVGDRIDSLPRSIRLARQIRKSVKGNMLFAVSYNLVGMTLGALGVLHPVIAALVMVVSSSVVSWRVIAVTRRSY